MRRHSLIVSSDGQFSVMREGDTDFFFQSTVSPTCQKVFTYEEYGDLIHRTLVVAFAGANVRMFIGHTIIEQPPEDGSN